MHDRLDPRTPSSIDEAPPELTAPGRTQGNPLPTAVQARMERSFGMDMSAVRIHEGAQAPAMGALAYAQGADLHFAPGRYDPHSERGLALLGHELAHVAQHAEGRASGPQAKGEHGGGNPALETEADAMGDRAARGEPARPGGARISAVRDPDAAIHRMIDTAAPVKGSKWDVIERYLSRTQVNQRKQTFSEAVEEYIATSVTGSDVVKKAWEDIARLRGKTGKEDEVLALVATIRKTINDQKSEIPDHPNKKGITPKGERYETIPQSKDSMDIAAAVRTALIDNMLDTYKEQTIRPRGGTPFTKKTYIDPVDRKRKKVQGYWSTGFMLGVLVRPDGKRLVSHSGFMGPSQDAAFGRLVTTAGYTPVQHGEIAYNTLQSTFKGETDLSGVSNHSVKKDGKNKDKVMNESPTGKLIESGNPMGVCAAPQALETTRGLTDDFPKELTGKTQLAMTEVWVASSTTSTVEVHDVHDRHVRYRGNQDVPSCLTCQHQLRKIMKKLTDLRRNVVNRENVRTSEDHRWELVAAVEQLKEVLRSKEAQNAVVGHIIPGGTSVRIGSDVGALDREIVAYAKAIDTQALERTKHPEHVEHDDKSKVKQLAPLVESEKSGRKHHNEALWEKRTEVGRMLQPDVAREDGSGERARTKTGKTLSFNQRGKLKEDKGTLVDSAHLVNAREKRALEEAQVAQEISDERDEGERQAVEQEDSMLQRARRELGKLDYYKTSGYLLGEQAEHHRKVLSTNLEAYPELTRKILDAKPSDKDLFALNKKIELAMRALSGSVHDIEYQVSVGHDRVRDKRSEDFQRDANTSSHRREQTSIHQARERETEVQMLQTIELVDAQGSSKKREASEAEHADRLIGLAQSLAQYYDTSIDYQLQQLLAEDHGQHAPTDGPPPTDHSDDYID